MLHSHSGWIRDCSFLRGRGALVGFGWGSREKNGFKAGSSKENEGKGDVTWKRLMKWLDVLLFKKYPFANKYRQYINLLENFLLLLIKFPRLLKHCIRVNQVQLLPVHLPLRQRLLQFTIFLFTSVTVGVAFRIFAHSVLLRIQEAVHISVPAWGLW